MKRDGALYSAMRRAEPGDPARRRPCVRVRVGAGRAARLAARGGGRAVRGDRQRRDACRCHGFRGRGAGSGSPTLSPLAGWTRRRTTGSFSMSWLKPGARGGASRWTSTATARSAGTSRAGSARWTWTDRSGCSASAPTCGSSFLLTGFTRTPRTRKPPRSRLSRPWPRGCRRRGGHRPHPGTLQRRRGSPLLAARRPGPRCGDAPRAARLAAGAGGRGERRAGTLRA